MIRIPHFLVYRRPGQQILLDLQTAFKQKKYWLSNNILALGPNCPTSLNSDEVVWWIVIVESELLTSRDSLSMRR